MINYIKRNLFGNAVAVLFLTPAIIVGVLLLPLGLNSNFSESGAGLAGLEMFSPILGIIFSILFYLYFKGKDILLDQQSLDLILEQKIEKISLILFGFFSVIVIALFGYIDILVGPTFSLIFAFPAIVLTRQWSFYKRLCK
jgi:hypothetical protein